MRAVIRFLGRGVEGGIVLALLLLVLWSVLGEELKIGLRAELVLAWPHLLRSLDLLVPGVLIILMAAMPLGWAAARYPDHPLMRLMMAKAHLSFALPVLIVGTAFVILGEWSVIGLPTGGNGVGEALADGWNTGLTTRDGQRHLVLPLVTICASLLGVMIARARDRHLGRPHQSMIMGSEMGFLLASLIVVEQIFDRKGLGSHLIAMAERGNSTGLAAAAVLMAMICLVVQALAELAVPSRKGRVR